MLPAKWIQKWHPKGVMERLKQKYAAMRSPVTKLLVEIAWDELVQALCNLTKICFQA